MLDICLFGKIQDGDSALFTEIRLSRLSLRRALSLPPASGRQNTISQTDSKVLALPRPRAARGREKFYLLKGVKKDIIKKISFIKAGIWLRR